MADTYIRGVAVKHLHLNVLRGNVLCGMKVPLPLQPEQARIAAKVDELMALCDTLKTRLKSAQTTQLQLTDAMAEQEVA